MELELIFAWIAGFLPTVGLGEAGRTTLLFGLLSSSSSEAVLARSADFLATAGLGAGAALAASPLASGSFAAIGPGVATISEELLPRVCFLTIGLLLRTGLLVLVLLALFGSGAIFIRFSVELVIDLEEIFIFLAGLVLTAGGCMFVVTAVPFWSFKRFSVDELGEALAGFLARGLTVVVGLVPLVTCCPCSFEGEVLVNFFKTGLGTGEAVVPLRDFSSLSSCFVAPEPGRSFSIGNLAGLVAGTALALA